MKVDLPLPAKVKSKTQVDPPLFIRVTSFVDLRVTGCYNWCYRFCICVIF